MARSAAGLDSETRVSTQFLLLGALVADEQFDDSGLDGFMAEARVIADKWTS
ncbi:hypothetical protein [Actinopolymorpha pittospori]|uniref:Uncharacterized protein n=1 Tax=Actinopolymorpha pittospori TaxID=648752 RepID=A0A927RIB4_9ACTN|nr:hypothetical protein [Actinopolymorpha pittospori]MBE1606001.1 hypothetical protein [Actinopolymorpha pittospori]